MFRRILIAVVLSAVAISGLTLAVAKNSGQPVGCNTAILAATPTITAGAYSANDAVGGMMTLTSAGLGGQSSGIINSITIIDLAKQSLGIDIFIFDRSFTPTADNAAFDPSDGDMANCIGVISVSASDYYPWADGSVACKTNVNIPYVIPSDGTTIYAQAVTRGTPTYAATTDLTFKFGVTQD